MLPPQRFDGERLSAKRLYVDTNDVRRALLVETEKGA